VGIVRSGLAVLVGVGWESCVLDGQQGQGGECSPEDWRCSNGMLRTGVLWSGPAAVGRYGPEGVGQEGVGMERQYWSGKTW
jgi:hypothetical protein